MKQLLILMIGLGAGTLSAQSKLSVQRCADIDRQVPIQNIYIDDDNNKWVADRQGLFLAQSPDFASTVEMEAEQWSLLSVRDGNRELNFPKAVLESAMAEAFSQITAAHLHQTSRELWIGTEESGVFQFRTEPELALIEQHTSGNSKLRSDRIQTLHTTGRNQLVIGTDDGMLVKEGKKITSYGKYFTIDAITDYEGVIWIVSDGEVLELDEKGRLLPMDEKPGMIDGGVVDIAFDSEGRLWIASEIVSRYDFSAERFDRYGPAQDFTSQYVELIAVDQDDAVWVGTRDKGVYFIGRSSSMSASVVVSQKLGCDAGSKDAALQVRASGGEPPYIYQWTGGLSGENPQNLGPGVYMVTVTDQNGRSTRAEGEIVDSRLIVTAKVDRTADIGRADGKVSLQVDGGKPGYRFQWDNGEATRVANQLGAGEHSVTITDENGCSTVTTIEMTESKAPLAAEIQQTGSDECGDGESGAALSVKVTGGEAPYDYKWNDATLNGAEVSSLKPGIYAVTVTDAASTTTVASLEIAAPKPIEAIAEVERPANTGASDGVASVIAKGGAGGFVYAWDDGEATARARKLAAGKHRVTVTDRAGCAVTVEFQMTEDLLPLSVNIAATAEVKCTGGSNGTLTAEVTGGKGPYSYQWQEGSSGATLAGVGAGEYQLTVTDATGNTSTGSMVLAEPEQLKATVLVRSAASANNADGRARARLEGGTGSYSFQWDNGETKEIAQALAAGTHRVTVTDENGCTTIASVEITEDILPLSVGLEEGQSIACAGSAGASLQATVQGGKSPFQFKWSTNQGNGEQAGGLTAGEYSISVTDAAGNSAEAAYTIPEPKPLQVSITPDAPASTNKADGKATVRAEGGTGNYSYAWDSGEAGRSAAQLAAGPHTVTVSDENGCEATASLEVTEDILPLTLQMRTEGTIDCAGEQTASIDLEVSGGKPPFEFSWSVEEISGTQGTNLGAGEYAVTVTDAAGTRKVVEATITEPEPLSLSIRVDAPASTNNADGQASAKVSGGTAPYTFQWDNGATGAAATDLAPGLRAVTVTDAGGCSRNAEVEINENILPLQISASQSAPVKCFGGEEGAIKVNAEGGKPPYKYTSNGDEFSGPVLDGLQAGSYLLAVEDASGLKQETQIEITQPEPLEATLVENGRVTNENARDGKAELQVEGGTAPYSFEWDNGEAGRSAKQLTFGPHTVKVIDYSMCETTVEFETDKRIMPALTAGALSQGQTIQVSRLYFEADSTIMTEESYPVLNEIADFLKENPLVAIEVGGHTNNVPPHEYCDQLSSERAKSVALYIAQQGIDPNRLVYKGYGKREPKYSNRTEDGRRRNQRVEIKILRIQ